MCFKAALNPDIFKILNQKNLLQKKSLNWKKRSGILKNILMISFNSILMLSKSKFILGQQCVKSFWFDINNIEPTNPADEAAEARLSNEVGEISKTIFPNGKEVPYLPGEQHVRNYKATYR